MRGYAHAHAWGQNRQRRWLVVGDKEVRSFTVDSEMDRRMSDDDETNWSAVIRNFLEHYLAMDAGEEAALLVRLEQLDQEIAEKRKDLDKLEREKERVEEKLEDRRSKLDDVVDDIIAKIEEERMTKEQIEPSNEAIKNFAEKARVSPQRLVEEVRGRLW